MNHSNLYRNLHDQPLQPPRDVHDVQLPTDPEDIRSMPAVDFNNLWDLRIPINALITVESAAATALRLGMTGGA